MNKDYLNAIDSYALVRENSKFYIPLSEDDKALMLKKIGANSLQNIFDNIEEKYRFKTAPQIGEALSTEDTIKFIENIAAKNKNAKISFLSNRWKYSKILSEISNIRGLTTAYTPYQPERSQGTLITHWIYQCAISALTGFEAVNCSLYDGSSAIWEAITCAVRLTKKQTAIIPMSLPACDIEVIKTFAKHTQVKLEFVNTDEVLGLININELRKILSENSDVACLLIPQTNRYGCLEDVDALSNICDEFKVKKIAVIDAILLAKGGLKEASNWGNTGADIAVGEALNLCGPSNFGGPALGVFAIRFNDNVKNDIRQAPGRFVGRAKDLAGRNAFSMILSTREQHIRREKAGSNICSNEAFMATLAGANLLALGEEELTKSLTRACKLTKYAFEKLTSIAGFSYPFAETPFFNSFVLAVPADIKKIIADASKNGIHLSSEASYLKFSFSDTNTEAQIDKLYDFLFEYSKNKKEAQKLPEISANLSRENSAGIPKVEEKELLAYYKKLGESNISPDLACYPLGSCTMKYNPYLNDALANLEGFTNSHPHSPQSDIQGSLEILYLFAEKIKAITGLDDVALQPVAGAQGELCALKMIQAYQADNSKTKRDIILIPSSAHGTNFATATAAGFLEENIIHLAAGDDAQLSIPELKVNLEKYADRVAAIMITNPNTSGILENRFAEISELVHKAGGLVFMDGANFNAIAAQLNLKSIGVDAVHNNLHKTWSISHGGGGPGDAFVAVDAKLADYIPSYVIEKSENVFKIKKPSKSIGSLHANFGNFAHKVRALSYILKLGAQGVQAMSANAVLAARYLYESLKPSWESLPKNCEEEKRMHEFILTLSQEDFESLKNAGVENQQAIARIGKLFLDYGFHAPTVAFPEVFGLMIEPTESYTKAELDRFAAAVISIKKMIKEQPQSVAKAPRFTPIDRVDEVAANRKPILSEKLTELPEILPNRRSPTELSKMSISEIEKLIIED